MIADEIGIRNMKDLEEAASRLTELRAASEIDKLRYLFGLGRIVGQRDGLITTVATLPWAEWLAIADGAVSAGFDTTMSTANDNRVFETEIKMVAEYLARTLATDFVVREEEEWETTSLLAPGRAAGDVA